MYSNYNKGKFVVAERFISASKNKIYKRRTVVSKNISINKLAKIIGK